MLTEVGCNFWVSQRLLYQTKPSAIGEVEKKPQCLESKMNPERMPWRSWCGQAESLIWNNLQKYGGKVSEISVRSFNKKCGTFNIIIIVHQSFKKKNWHVKKTLLNEEEVSLRKVGTFSQFSQSLMIFNVSLSYDSLHVGPYRVPVHLIFHQSDNQGGFGWGTCPSTKRW